MRTTVRLLIVAVLGTLAATAAPGSAPPAHAECVNPAPINTALNQAKSVFVGEVVALTNRNREATMRVLEVWKGRDLPQSVVVEGGSGDPTSFGPDDRTFQQGRTYLVLSDDVRSPFESDRCTATKVYTPLGGRAIPVNMAGAVGVSTARAPLSSPGDDGDAVGAGTSMLPLVNIALVLVGLVAVISMYRKLSARGRRVPERASQEARPKKASAAGGDSLGKLSRTFSLTGMFGRSGLDSSKKLRGRRARRRG